MNSITKLIFSNLKGQSRDLALQPLTILTGENHAGKTAVLDAITIATLGHHPRLGKSNPATFRLSSNNSMSVTIAGDGWSIARDWKQSGKTVKASANETGTPPTFSAATLDPEAFLAAKPKERLELLAMLTTETDDELAGKIAAWEADLGRVGAQLTAIEKLEALEEAARGAAAGAREIARRYTGTVQGGNELGDADLPVIEAEYKQLQETTFTLAAEVVNADNAARGLEMAADAAADAKEELESIPTDLIYRDPQPLMDAHERAMADRMAATRAAGDIAQKIAAQRAEETRLRKLIGQGENDSYETIAQWTRDAISEAEALTVPDIAGIRKRLGEAKDAASHQRTLMNAAKESAKRIAEKRASLEQLECCPTCKASAPGWRDTVLQTMNAAYDADIASAKKHEEALAAATADINVIEAELTEGEKTVRLIGEIPGMKEKLAAIEAHRDVNGKLAHNLTLKDEIDRQLEAAEQNEKSALEAFQTNNANFEAHRRRQELEGIIAAAPEPAAVSAALDKLEHSRAAHAEALRQCEAAQQRRDAAQKAAGQRALIAKAKEELEKAEADAEKMAALQKEIRSTREEAVNSGYKPIIAAAAEFGQGVIDGSLAVNDGEIGIIRGPAFIPVECMSGTERVVVTASIQAALSATTCGIVVVDEASRMSRQNRLQFAANLRTAIKAGRIRQAIIVDHDRDAWSKSEGVIDIA